MSNTTASVIRTKFMTIPNNRVILFAISILCASSIGVALIMQYVFAMEPCPLCTSQRLFIILAGISTFVAALALGRQWAKKLFCALAIIFALVGSGISARHVYIQNLPEDEVPLCGPGLSYMFETRPFMEALDVLFKGDGHCADVNWSFLGLTIPGWTFVMFIFVALISGWVFFRPDRP